MTTKNRKQKQSDILISFVEKNNLFHTADDNPFVDIFENGYRATHPVDSRIFKRYLEKRFYEETSSAPNSGAMQEAINNLKAKAIFDGEKHEVFFRVGKHEETIYWDLGDDTGRVAVIDAECWRLVDNPPIRFIRTAEMEPLPVPVKGGSVDDLKQFINVKSEEQFALMKGWILATLRGEGPYPVLVLSGEQGSAKSTFCETIRALIDPNKVPLRSLPRDARDLFLSATRNHILVFDNISNISSSMSNALCMLSTGGGLGTRELRTNRDETTFQECCPMILNGITNFVNMPDFADRSIFVELDRVTKDRRRTKTDIWREFEAARPRIFGALLQEISTGIKNLPNVEVPNLPRMADPANWIVACEGNKRVFLDAYEKSCKISDENLIDSDLVANGIKSFMTSNNYWQGRASDLLARLIEELDESVVKSKSFPKTPGDLSNRIVLATPPLREVGIMIDRNRKKRSITIHKEGSNNFFDAESSEISSRKPAGNSNGIFGD